LAVAVLALLPLPVLGQSYSENFDGVTPPTDWTLAAPVGGVGWAFDATSATAPGGPTFSGTRSLNYNNGIDFANGATNSGTADSPTLTVIATPVTVTFQCNWDTEFGSTWDQKWMEVINPTTGVALAGGSFQVYDLAPAPRTCPGSGVWHSHTIDITAALAGATAFRIRFRLNTIDSAANWGAGWFVDNLSVTNACADTLPPTSPLLLSPPDAGYAVSPPGVVLDWSDSTDTSSCGPSGIAGYIVEVDTTNPPVAPFSFSANPVVSTATTTVLAPGVYFWQVRAVDVGGLQSANSTVWSFTVEAPLAPVAADTLFVNETAVGAQLGRSGFVSPVIDLEPSFSAIYRDGNTFDSAAGVEFQVADDPAFALASLVYSSPILSLVPALPVNTRCPDMVIPLELRRDSTYFWRCRFTDSGGLLGVWSASQSFQTGDDYDFGARPGSKNHSKKCFVATAAWGGVTPEVSGLMAFRSGVLEPTAVGRAFSRSYRAIGPSMASAIDGEPGIRPIARAGLAPLAAAASTPLATGAASLLAVAALIILAIRRIG